MLDDWFEFYKVTIYDFLTPVHVTTSIFLYVLYYNDYIREMKRQEHYKDRNT